MPNTYENIGVMVHYWLLKQKYKSKLFLETVIQHLLISLNFKLLITDMFFAKYKLYTN